MRLAPDDENIQISARIAMARNATGTKPAARSLAAEGTPQDIFALIGKAENIEQAAVAMQAMSHPLRIKILCLLSSGEMMVQEITDAVGSTQSNISQHLAILRACRMIQSRKEATKVLYRIEDERILKMISLTRDIFCGV